MVLAASRTRYQPDIVFLAAGRMEGWVVDLRRSRGVTTAVARHRGRLAF